MNDADRKRITKIAEDHVGQAKADEDDINVDALREHLVGQDGPDGSFCRYFTDEIIREVKKLARRAGVELTHHNKKLDQGLRGVGASG